MQFISYLFFRLGVLAFSLLPFGGLYLISDGLVWLLRDVFKYRQTVIHKNLEIAFPEKSPAELDKISKQFYRNLCDIMLETIKGFSVSKKNMLERFRFVNPELLEADYQAGRSVVMMGGHFGNWEWGAKVINSWFSHTVLGVYKPLKNKYIDDYAKRRRGKWDTILCPINEVRRAIIELKDKQTAFVFITDQTPSNLNTAYWVDFLGRETAFAPGAEKVANAYNFSVYFYDVQRLGRGKYQVVVSELCKSPQELADGELTQLYANRTAEVIRRSPAEWLWSHKRWKHVRGDKSINVYSKQPSLD